MIKLGDYLYVYPDEIAAVAFPDDEVVLVYLSGNPEPFVLESAEAKEEIVHWLQRGKK